MKSILVPIDFSGVTGEVIARAASLARVWESQVWLLHIVTTDRFTGAQDRGREAARAQAAAHLRARRQQVQDQARELRSKGVNATAILVQGPTVKMILNKAAKVNADVIVIGSHRDSSLYRYLVGSVSEGVLQEARCPLFIIPSRERRFVAA